VKSDKELLTGNRKYNFHINHFPHVSSAVAIKNRWKRHGQLLQTRRKILIDQVMLCEFIRFAQNHSDSQW
ncbi:MAG: hypothetical protein ACKOPK_12100, partial [Dolichospermum sp.]